MGISKYWASFTNLSNRKVCSYTAFSQILHTPMFSYCVCVRHLFGMCSFEYFNLWPLAYFVKNNWLLHFLRFCNCKITKYFFKQTEGYVQKNIDEESPMLLNHLHAKQRPPVLIVEIKTNWPKWPTCTISYKPACLLWPVHSPSKCYYFSQSKEVWENALHHFLSLVSGLACVFG